MSEYPFGGSRRLKPARRGRRLVRAILVLLAVLAVLLVGIAIGKALNDGPDAGRMVTYVRTLQPLPQQPAGP